MQSSQQEQAVKVGAVQHFAHGGIGMPQLHTMAITTDSYQFDQSFAFDLTTIIYAISHVT
jgi:hypothetical protein